MLDKVTEMVAHMIGIFQTTFEEGRMRDSYLQINAARHADPDTGPLLSETPATMAPYQLEDFIPKIRYDDLPQGVPQSFRDTPLWGDSNVPVWLGLPLADLSPQMVFHGFAAQNYARPVLTLEPPGAVVTISYQAAFLSDNDLLRLADSGVVFVDPGIYDAQLAEYQAVAQAISAPISTALPSLGESSHDHALALHDQIGAIEGSDFTGATVTVLHGEAASGIHENGVEVEEATQIDDVMPAYFSRDDEPDANEDAAPDWAPGPFDGLEAAFTNGEGFTPSSGHEISTGANTMVNQTNITFSWLDAPVVVVMGDVIALNIISQTNMLVEHGQFGGAGAAATSAAYNSAVISVQSSVEPTDAPAGPEALSLPLNWAVTRIDGDLLTVNFSQQYSFLTDHDRGDVGFFSSSSYISLGDNTIVNLTDILEIGFGYDLIIVGGNMISINQISQINVLIDSDMITYSGLLPTAFSAGDNLLFNGASIAITGIDSYQPMQGNFADTAKGLAAGGTEIGADVAHDSVFEGVDILRVLYISGDATTVNLVNQTNILGDSDQVHLAMDNFQSTTGAEITVTTGSNVAINLASISQFGVDSTVFVEGEVYGDALLYQAGFIDTAATPQNVALCALANEAVAFLADDMIGPEAPGDTGIGPTAIDATHSPDVMQTMLA